MTEKIEQFFAADGRLLSVPARHSKRIAVLKRIAEGLDPAMKYPEKQLNEYIATFHPDTAAIRRYMIELQILQRDTTSTYWRTESVNGNL